MAEREHEFTIPTHDLDMGGKAFAFPVRAAWVRGVIEDTDLHAPAEDGELTLRASRTGSSIVVNGRLVGSVVATCGRCGEPAVIKVDEAIGVLAVPAAEVSKPSKGSKTKATKKDDDDEDDIEVDPDDPETLAYEGERVILDDLVRDELLLAVPMIPLCQEDCPGIKASPFSSEPEPTGGIDPRLAPLLKFSKFRQ
jgi:uncharacterized protein